MKQRDNMNLISAQLAKMAEEHNKQISQIMTPSLVSMIESTRRISERLSPQMFGLDKVQEQFRSQLFGVDEVIRRINEENRASLSALVDMKMNIPKFQVPTFDIIPIQEMLSSYENIYSELVLSTLPPSLLTSASSDTFLQTSIIHSEFDDYEGSVSHEELNDFSETRGIEISDSVEQALSEMDRKLVILLRGARNAAVSNNPDRIRHSLSSYRELLKSLLNHLVHDSEAKSWMIGTKFEKEKFGLHTKFAYLVQCVGNQPWEDFIFQDALCMRKFVWAVSEGVHAEPEKISETTFQIIKLRVEAYILHITIIYSEARRLE